MSEITSAERTSSNTRFTFETPASAESVALARLFLAALVRHFGAPADRVEDARLAASEACGEVLRLAGGVAAHLRLDVDRRPRLLHVRVSCSGPRMPADGGDDRRVTDDVSMLALDVLHSLFEDATLTSGGMEYPAVTFSVPVGLTDVSQH